jgi:tRNA(Ile)-lysidine synthetase-like protein
LVLRPTVDVAVPAIALPLPLPFPRGAGASATVGAPASRVSWEPTGWTLHADPEVDTGERRDVAAWSVGALLPPGLHAPRMSVRVVGTGDLSVRTRQDGDRVRTPGGTRTLADVMSDASIPRGIRGLLPVVVDATDQVVWVPGLVVSEAWRTVGSDHHHDTVAAEGPPRIVHLRVQDGPARIVRATRTFGGEEPAG